MNVAVNMERMTEKLVEWFQQSLSDAGGNSVVIGISGGKDSSVAAALSVKALGKERVYGVLLPDGKQTDIEYSYGICKHLDIPHQVVDIKPMTDAFIQQLKTVSFLKNPDLSNQTRVNMPARVRMVTLFGIAQSMEGARVLNTSNLSEDWVGYGTLYGDLAGAFSPLGDLTSDEVIDLGRHLGVPEKYLVKDPSDGLTGITDEENLGFSYETLNRYIRTGIIEDREVKEKIDQLHQLNRFKFEPIPRFSSELPKHPK